MRILVIGCGSIGRRHAVNLRSMGERDLLLYDAEEARAELLARETGGTAVENLAAGFAEGPDAALICAPTSLHLELAREALRNKCHLFIEKPISHSTEGVSRLDEEAKLRRRVLQVGYNFRFDKVARKLRIWIGEGRIGRVVSARFHFGSSLERRHPEEDFRQGYGARKSLGGGVILDAVHELDLACWFFGQPETVHCTGGRFSAFETDVEDVAEVTLGYKDKVISIHLDYVQWPPERFCQIIGTSGQIGADFYARQLRLYDAEAEKWIDEPVMSALEDSYELEMKNFLECISGKCDPEMNAETAMQSLALAEAAKKSMAVDVAVPPEFALAAGGTR